MDVASRFVAEVLVDLPVEVVVEPVATLVASNGKERRVAVAHIVVERVPSSASMDAEEHEQCPKVGRKRS